MLKLFHMELDTAVTEVELTAIKATQENREVLQTIVTDLFQIGVACGFEAAIKLAAKECLEVRDTLLSMGKSDGSCEVCAKAIELITNREKDLVDEL